MKAGIVKVYTAKVYQNVQPNQTKIENRKSSAGRNEQGKCRWLTVQHQQCSAGGGSRHTTMAQDNHKAVCAVGVSKGRLWSCMKAGMV